MYPSGNPTVLQGELRSSLPSKRVEVESELYSPKNPKFLGRTGLGVCIHMIWRIVRNARSYSSCSAGVLGVAGSLGASTTRCAASNRARIDGCILAMDSATPGVSGCTSTRGGGRTGILAALTPLTEACNSFRLASRSLLAIVLPRLTWPGDRIESEGDLEELRAARAMSLIA